MKNVVKVGNHSTKKLIVEKVENMSIKLNMGYEKEEIKDWVNDLIKKYPYKTIKELDKELDSYFSKVGSLIHLLHTYVGEDIMEECAELLFIPDFDTANESMNFIKDGLDKFNRNEIYDKQFLYLLVFYEVGVDEEDAYRLINEIDLEDEERLKYITYILSLEEDKKKAIDFVASPKITKKELKNMYEKLKNKMWCKTLYTQSLNKKSDNKSDGLESNNVTNIEERIIEKKLKNILDLYSSFGFGYNDEEIMDYLYASIKLHSDKEVTKILKSIEENAKKVKNLMLKWNDIGVGFDALQYDFITPFNFEEASKTIEYISKSLDKCRKGVLDADQFESSISLFVCKVETEEISGIVSLDTERMKCVTEIIGLKFNEKEKKRGDIFVNMDIDMIDGMKLEELEGIRDTLKEKQDFSQDLEDTDL